MAAVWPELPSVHDRVALVGDSVLVLLTQPVNDRLGGVGTTTRLTDVEAAVPAGVGVAVSVPE